MIAGSIMRKDIVSINDNQTLSDALLSLDKHKLHAIAVIDAKNRAVGSISTVKIVEHCLPKYMLDQHFVSVDGIPDFENFLQKRRKAMQSMYVRDVYEQVPMVLHSASLLSVAADIIRGGTHESALVINEQQHLLGIVSASDVLRALGMMSS
ncbi:MAG: CBS domain-containing protein [Mariprofundales bacterium]